MIANAPAARIVLIEDNPADVYLVREAVRNSRIPCELVWLSTVDEALSVLVQEATCQPDAILLDLNLADGDGLMILQAIRQSNRLKNTPVAILTSSRSPRDMQETQAMGANLYVFKPSDLEQFFADIAATIRKLLGVSEAGVGSAS
jgi:two-component system, chemotaxis family, response regulator Rcp1